MTHEEKVQHIEKMETYVPSTTDRVTPQESQDHPCPTCGRCPTCGHTPYQPAQAPYVPPNYGPFWPYSPYPWHYEFTC